MRRALIRAVGLLSALVLGACSNPTLVVLLEPEIESMTARAFPFRFQGTWGLLVEGVVAEGELPSNARIPFSVSTSSGDAEELRLWPRLCKTENDRPYLCGQFNFSVAAGRHVGELRGRLGRLDGGLAFVGTSGNWANVWLFDGKAERAMNEVRDWPGVRSVYHDGLLFPAVLGQPVAMRVVVNVSPVTFDPPRPGDGVVQARAGDVVTLRYVSANDAEVTASFTMCEEPSGNTGTAIVGLGDEPICG